MMHCHHLQHEDNGMMSQFVIGNSGTDPAQVAPAKPVTDLVAGQTHLNMSDRGKMKKNR